MSTSNNGNNGRRNGNRGAGAGAGAGTVANSSGSVSTIQPGSNASTRNLSVAFNGSTNTTGPNGRRNSFYLSENTTGTTGNNGANLSAIPPNPRNVHYVNVTGPAPYNNNTGATGANGNNSGSVSRPGNKNQPYNMGNGANTTGPNGQAGGKKSKRRVTKLTGKMVCAVGSRVQVWNGTAHHTSGGLQKKDLMMSHGRIVSKSRHELGKKNKLFKKLTALTKKGKFKLITKAEAKKALKK